MYSQRIFLEPKTSSVCGDFVFVFQVFAVCWECRSSVSVGVPRPHHHEREEGTNEGVVSFQEKQRRWQGIMDRHTTTLESLVTNISFLSDEVLIKKYEVNYRIILGPKHSSIFSGKSHCMSFAFLPWLYFLLVFSHDLSVYSYFCSIRKCYKHSVVRYSPKSFWLKKVNFGAVVWQFHSHKPPTCHITFNQ